MKGLKLDKREPAARPVTLDLSVAEIIALANYHMREAKAISTRFGSDAMKLSAKLMSQARKISALHAECAAQVEAHQQRARGIISIAQSVCVKEGGK